MSSDNPNDRIESVNHFEKFRLLMWKNFLLQSRHKVQTFIQILIPILFTSLLILIRSLVEPEVVSQNTFYSPFAINNIALRYNIELLFFVTCGTVNL